MQNIELSESELQFIKLLVRIMLKTAVNDESISIHTNK
jgi:hypothetical protein